MATRPVLSVAEDHKNFIKIRMILIDKCLRRCYNAIVNKNDY